MFSEDVSLTTKSTIRQKHSSNYQKEGNDGIYLQTSDCITLHDIQFGAFVLLGMVTHYTT